MFDLTELSYIKQYPAVLYNIKDCWVQFQGILGEYKYIFSQITLLDHDFARFTSTCATLLVNWLQTILFVIQYLDMLVDTLNCCSPTFGVICLTFWHPKSFFGLGHTRSRIPNRIVILVSVIFCRQKAQMTTSTAAIHAINSTFLELILLCYLLL